MIYSTEIDGQTYYHDDYVMWKYRKGCLVGAFLGVIGVVGGWMLATAFEAHYTNQVISCQLRKP